MMEWKSVGMIIIPNIWKVIKFMFQITSHRYRYIIDSLTLQQTCLAESLLQGCPIRCWTISRYLGNMTMVNPALADVELFWLVVYLPLWKIWVRQLGWLFPKYGKIKMFQTTNQYWILWVCVPLPSWICQSVVSKHVSHWDYLIASEMDYSSCNIFPTDPHICNLQVLPHALFIFDYNIDMLIYGGVA